MKELPIIFSGDMVRAILEGRKVQTRRITKPQPVLLGQYQSGERILEWKEKGILQAITSAAAIILESPFGPPGDFLWVREEWRRSREWIRSKLPWKTKTAPQRVVSAESGVRVFSRKKQPHRTADRHQYF